MGSGASSKYEGGDVSQENAAEFKAGLKRLSSKNAVEIAEIIKYESDISNASVDQLKSALSKNSEEDRKLAVDTLLSSLPPSENILAAGLGDELGLAGIGGKTEERAEGTHVADKCERSECSAETDDGAGLHGDKESTTKHPKVECEEFSAKLAALIANKDEPCDMGPISDCCAWPNDFDHHSPVLKSSFQAGVDSKAAELVNEYSRVMPDTYNVKRIILENAMKLQKDAAAQLERLREKTKAEFLVFIKERDADGNGVISHEEATVIAKAIFKIDKDLPKDHPLMSSVGKPLEFMADLLTSNANPVKQAVLKVQRSAAVVAEKQADADAVKKVNSLAHYPDLLTQTVELKEYLDSLTKEQFDQALAENSTTWKSLISNQGIQEKDFCFPKVVPEIDLETTLEMLDAQHSASVEDTASKQRRTTGELICSVSRTAEAASTAIALRHGWL